MRSAVGRLLKQRTAETHERVEARLALLDPGLGDHPLRDALIDMLAGFAGFWAPVEATVDGWAVENPDLAADLDWPLRRRTALLRGDLARFGVDTVAHAVPPFAAPTDAEVLGWLYVSEGSTLGGAMLDRALRPRLGVEVRSFTPYPEGPGPMWRAYLQTVTDWVGPDDERCEQVVSAAETSFGALEQWLVSSMGRAA